MNKKQAKPVQELTLAELEAVSGGARYQARGWVSRPGPNRPRNPRGNRPK